MTFTYSATTITPPSPNFGDTKVVPVKKQNRHAMEDGTARVYTRSTVEWLIYLTLRCSYSELIALRNFFKNTVYYSRYAFTFTPDSGMNAGAGLGTAVTVRLWQDDIPEPYDAPGKFTVNVVLRTTSSGSGSPS